MREFDRLDAEPIPNPWEVMADTIRGELERRAVERRLPPVPLRGLSEGAIRLIAYLHCREHGRTFLARLRSQVPVDVDVLLALDELLGLGLVKVEMSVDEEGDPAEPIVELRYDVDLPEPPRPAEGA
jgi:hypothetical protein